MALAIVLLVVQQLAVVANRGSNWLATNVGRKLFRYYSASTTVRTLGIIKGWQAAVEVAIKIPAVWLPVVVIHQ